MEIIVSHTNADFDTIASMLAAKKLYPEARLAFPGSLEKGVRDSFEKLDFPYPVEKAKNINLDSITRLILVDIKHPARIGRFKEVVGREGVEIHIYDHHPETADDISGSLEVTCRYGSNTTILTLIIRERKLPLTPTEATIMMLGIYEDTGSLSYPSTTTEDYDAASFLLSHGADLTKVSTLLKRELTPKEVSLLNDLIHSAVNYNICGIDVLVAELSIEGYKGEISILAHKMIEVEGADCLFLLADMEGRVHLIARNRLKDIDVGEVAHAMGGGGHPTAASATLKGVTLIQAKEQLLKVLERHISPKRSALEIMSTPPITVSSGTTIAGAREILVRYNINALPVVEKGGHHCIGIITRQIIEKAIYHDLGELPVEEYMNSDISIAESSASIDAIRDSLIQHGQRLLPVVDGGELRGVITRTDLLRLYNEEVYESPSGAVDDVGKSVGRRRHVTGLMRERLQEWVFDILQDAGRVAEELGYKAYVVGGFVRDLILRYENLDIDIVIEGDGIIFAKKFAAQKGCRVRSHKRFGTAVIVFPDGFKVDVATARLEYYERPGALPTVELSSLKLDLYRRDFTINTLAIELDINRFGLLIDYFGARRDIKERVVKVLHNLSFIEDPTRVFRAVRFSERYGFKIGDHTVKLIKNAVKIDIFRNLAGVRVLDELRRILEEERVVDALRRLKELDLLRFIHPKVTLDKGGLALVEKARDVLSWYRLLYKEREVNGWLVLLLALTDPLSRDDLVELVERFSIAGRFKGIVVVGRGEGLRVLQPLSYEKGMGESRIYHLLRSIPLEVLLYIMARAKSEEARRAISHFISELSGVKNLLTGDDLREMGVPETSLCGDIMRRLLDKRLDGEVTTREEEVTIVREFLAKAEL
ncbi:MAG: CBS domain-containing protein [Deltaproteobacteria bacterium]|nr:CBS domain-containing protein [Deltaproteobacteria bacterium]